MSPADSLRSHLPSARSVFSSVNSVIGPVARSGLAGPLPAGAGLVMLKTVGRRTGIEREVPLLSLRLGQRLIVGTIRPTSQWFKNLAVDEKPEVWLCGRARPARTSLHSRPFSYAVLTLH